MLSAAGLDRAWIAAFAGRFYARLAAVGAGRIVHTVAGIYVYFDQDFGMDASAAIPG